MIDTVLPQEHARGFAASYAGEFSTLLAYLEARTNDAGPAVVVELRTQLEERGPLPTYSEHRRQHARAAGLPDAQTRERALLDGAVRGLNTRIASDSMRTDDEEARELHAYVSALVAFVRGEVDFPGLLDFPKVVHP